MLLDCANAEVYVSILSPTSKGVQRLKEESGVYLTVREIAQEMRISCPTVYRMASRAEIPVVRIGGRLLIPRKAYDEWLKRKMNVEKTGKA